MFENHAAVMLLVDPQSGSILDANKAAARFYGYTRSKLRSMLISEINILPPDQIELYRQKALNGKQNTFVFPHKVASGEIRTVEVHSTAISLGNSQILFSILHDISERKLLEKEIGEKQNQIREVIENSLDAAYKRNLRSNTYEYFSPVIMRISGYTPDEMMNASLEYAMGLMHPEDQAEFERIFAESLSGAPGTAHQVNYRFRHKDGQYRWFQDQFIVVQDAQGKPTALIGSVNDITERKQTEESLHMHQIELEMQNEELRRTQMELEAVRNRFQDLYNMAPVGYVTVSEKGLIIEANLTAAVILGVVRNRLLQARITKFIHREDQDIYYLYRKKIHETDEPTSPVNSCDLRMVKDDKTTFWSHLSASAARDVDGALVLHISLTDVTERKLAEEALLASEANLKTIFNASDDSIFLLEADATVAALNPISAEHIQLPPEKIVGRKFTDLLPADVAANRSPMIHQAVTRAEKVTFEDELNGQWMLNQIHPILNTAGKVDRLAVFSHDLTERKIMEDALRESEEKFRAMIELSKDGVLLVDEQGTVIEWNLANEQIMGIPANEAVGQPAWEVQIRQFPKARRDQITIDLLKQNILKILETGQSSQFNGPIEIQTELPSGEIRTILQNAFPIKTVHGYRMGVVLHDITERKQAELELLNTKEALEKANLDLQSALIREQELARTDGLTGINNRRHLFELAEQTIAVAIRYKQPLAVMMFDIDHFKQVNDVYGHDIGDRILEGVTRHAVAELRTGDVIGRYGGEEFIILLPMTIARQAYPLAERIRISVADLGVASEKGNVSVTLSIGIVEMLPDAKKETVEDLFRRADKAMYGAKFTGRNRTVIIE